MKKYKFVLPIVLVVLMIAACSTIVTNAVSEKQEYSAYIDDAHLAEKKKISIDVDEAYSKALEINSNADDYINWGSYYSVNSDYSMAVSIAEDALVKFPKNSEIYLFLMENYLHLKDYEAFFEIYDKCKSIGAADKSIDEIYESNKYLFSLEFDTYDFAYPFSSGVARTVINENTDDNETYFGYISDSGSIYPQYLSAGDFNSDEVSVAPVVNKNGEAYYINKEGQKKYVISPENIKVKELGFYSSKVLSVFDGEAYYLCDIKSNIIAGPFEYISTINNNIGVVKENNKWKIVNEKGEPISDQLFDDIILDSKQIAYRNGIFARVGDYYYLVNEKGEKICDAQFENACLFVDGFAAVKNGGKWGFIDNDGNLVIDYQYHDAKSFSNGFAPVKLNGSWGYIVYSEKDNKSIVAIDYQFEDATGFSGKSHVSMVKTNNKWKLMRLYI